MLTTAGLDWSAIKSPLTTTTPDGREVLINGKAALLRDVDGSVLDVIGDDWEPLQNADAFAFFDEFVREGGMQMHTAGSLKDGRIVWALAKISESFNVLGMEDQVDSYRVVAREGDDTWLTVSYPTPSGYSSRMIIMRRSHPQYHAVLANTLNEDHA